MRQLGIYRSVEYKIEKLTLHGEAIVSTRSLSQAQLRDVQATLRPLSRLLPRFERTWPVTVCVADARLVTYNADLLGCALVTLAMSAGFLCAGAYGPRFISIYAIPSVSMYPTLRVGDALLVEKVSLRRRPPTDGEIVLFRPPRRLQRMLRAGTSRTSRQGTKARDISQQPDGVLTWSHSVMRRNDLFVKRVVAVAGDIIEIRGKKVLVNGDVVDKAAPGSPNVAPRAIPEGYLFVVGDNAEHSLDSRFFGLLPVDCVVGRPVARIFPLDRFEIGV